MPSSIPDDGAGGQSELEQVLEVGDRGADPGSIPGGQRAVLRPDPDRDPRAVGDPGRRGLESACARADLDEQPAVVCPDDAAQHVDLRFADELGDEQVRRVVEHLVRGAELLHHSGVHHREAIGERQRLDLIVCDDDGGVAELALQHLQFSTDPLARGRIEVAQRLVEEQHRRVSDQCPRQCDALLLTAGQAGGPQRHQVVHLQPIADRRDHLLGALDLAGLQTVQQVLADRHRRIQRIALEADADAPLGRRQLRDLPVTDADGAARHRLQTGDHPQRRGLAAAGRPEQRDELARVRWPGRCP